MKPEKKEAINMSLLDFAKEELELIDDGSDMQHEANKDILELIETFSKQGHSGFSADYVSKLFNKLAHYQIISPLKDTGWNSLKDGYYQNNRLSSVFKEKKYGVYDIGVFYIKYENIKSTFSNGSYVYRVDFPYIQPKPIGINIPASLSDDSVPQSDITNYIKSNMNNPKLFSRNFDIKKLIIRDI